MKNNGGSHRKWLNPDSGRAAAIPDWGSKDLKLGTMLMAGRKRDLEDVERLREASNES